MISKELNDTLQQFSENVFAILSENIESVILYGSVVLHDFIPGKGDIDFVVITKKDLTDQQCSELIKYHDELRSGKYGDLAVQLEGAYYPYSIIQDPLQNKGKGLYIGTSRSGWKQITGSVTGLPDYAIIKRYGLTLHGNNIKAKIYDVTHEELKKNYIKTLKYNIEMTKKLNDLGFSLYAIYAGLRGLYTFEKNDFISKGEAIKWFLKEYPSFKGISLIKAIQGYRNPLTSVELKELNVCSIREKTTDLLLGLEKITCQLK